MPERNLQRDVGARAVHQHQCIVEAERLEEPGGVVGVLGGASARPVVPTAAEGAAPVISDHGKAGQPLGDRTPSLGIFGTSVDQEHSWPRTSYLRVQPRAIDGIPTDPRWLSIGQRVRVRPKIRLSHEESVRRHPSE